jgi:hypothetical protein
LALSAQYEEEGHPLSVFLYALKAPETKRQYPRRLKVFLDFLKLDGTLEQQSKEFLEISNLLLFVIVFCADCIALQ